MVNTYSKYISWLENVGIKDIALVGGKNASLGEMTRVLESKGIKVPGGFAISSEAYWAFINANNLKDSIKAELESLETGSKPLNKVGDSIRRYILHARFPEELETAIRIAYAELSQRYETYDLDVAVRSSATAEDLPDASFAGQQESFLNIRGDYSLLEACLQCYSSLFTDRAISYRNEKGFDHLEVALSICVQKMVRSDKAAAGVMFTLDPESGFPDVVTINASWGLGESVVQGIVTPDEYEVYKPILKKKSMVPIIGKKLGEKASKIIYAVGEGKPTKHVATSSSERGLYVLSDDEIMKLANWASTIEEHYQKPMDIEWAKDGETGQLYIVQARPETVHSSNGSPVAKVYRLLEKPEPILRGMAIGEAISAAKACVIDNASNISRFKEGSILVTRMTDPDWVPIMKKAAGIITDLGGRTSHAAIVSRELGIPAIVGTKEATKKIKNNEDITLSCAEGNEGHIYRGIVKYEVENIDSSDIHETRTKVMLNLANPGTAFRWWHLPNEGIGLARMEFIINNLIKIHPMALVQFSELKNFKVRNQIEELTRSYSDKTKYFVENLALGIAKIAASNYPHKVIVRMSDFKTNEYANLIGGKQFEPEEENPMLGFRGASRYYSDRYRQGFTLECWAIKRAREKIGLDNIVVMIPFCRTLDEADKVLDILDKNGLKRGVKGLEVYMMCEIPSNVILAEQFAEKFDGFSIGSNDLTQLVLGVDRDSSDFSSLFDERNEAVKIMIASVIKAAHSKGIKIGICGQAPSDYPDFVEFLVRQGIDSISLNPDSVIQMKKQIAEIESLIG